MTQDEAENKIEELNDKYFKGLEIICKQVDGMTEQEQIKLMFTGCALLFTCACSNFLVEDAKALDEILAASFKLIRATALAKWGIENDG